jgi:hypothetical protein
MLTARLTCWNLFDSSRQSGRSSGVEHNLAKVGVEGSNPFARSSFSIYLQCIEALQASRAIVLFARRWARPGRPP